MRLTFYTKESIVLLFSKTNLLNTTFSYHSKLILIFLLLILSINISFGNRQTNNWQNSSYFSTQIQNYSKALLTGVIKELETSQQEVKAVSKWTSLYQQFSSSATTINSRIVTGSDDAEEDIALDGINEGFVDISNSDLELGVESEAQLVGLRFTNIAIPKRARIVSAYVEFEGDETGSETTNLTIYGQAADDADTFSTTTKDISDRTKTTASVTWNNLATWAIDGKYQTTDIAPIIQEIVDRNGWISGNDLAVMIEGTGKRTAESYNGEATAAPLLVITYDEPLTSCTNLLTNEEFDNGTNDWLLNVDGSTAASAVWNIDNSNQLSGTNSVFVNVTNATSLPWNIQLLQENKSIVAGTEYQVVFEGKATAERDMLVAVQENSGAWDTYGSQTVTLTTEPQTYSFKFIAPVTNTGGIALIFHLAKSTDNVFIDNVRFSEACIAEICDNNIDDDGDGLIDNADTDCSNVVACTSCTSNNLFDNSSFETGTWSGSETFVPGVFATNLTNEPSDPLDSWGYDNAKWVESNKATDGNRFVYLNNDTDESVCFSQLYTFGDGNEINDCDTYQICFDWASFNSDYVNGRTTFSQPSIDFIFRDNADQKLKFISIPLGEAAANQNWNNLTWENLSFSFKFEGNLTIPANTTSIKVFISERDDYNHGLLLDNTSLCVVNSCSDNCPVTNMYPGFALDQVGNNCNWLDYTLDSDLNFTDNGDGTATIAGKIIDGVDADWDGASCTPTPCGVDDSWYLTLNLSNKQNWTALQAAGGTANVHTNCSEDNLDFWDVSGTLTGLGCNSGRTLTINSAASNYRLQIGYGGNSNDLNCEFGLSTWFDIEENGVTLQADIYGFLNETCYNKPTVCNLQFDNIAVSNCINQPLMDVATVDAIVSWTSAPANDTIEVSIDNKTEYIDVAGGVTSPQTIRFTIPADGSIGNNITVNWRNTTGCNQSTTYDAPSACSSNEIACNILYICGDDKPHDGDAWDHGWLEYLDAVNGSNTLTPAFSKADASGMGLYDPHNIANALTITLEDYDLIIVSATTEERLSNDLINDLKNTSTSVLNSNFKIVNDLGLTATEATYAFQNYMYTDNTTRETLYSFNNKVNPSYGTTILKGNYSANADAYLWKETGNFNDATDGILFAYTSDDALPGVDATHGDRVFLGYHMNGNYANPDRSIPTPDSLWFNPAKHLTLAGKAYLDAALILATANCDVTPEICDNGIDDDGDGLIDNDDPSCSIANAQCIGTNQGFESDFTDWETLGAPTITTDAYNGSKAALLDEDEESVIRFFDVNADSNYLLSFHHKGSGGSWRGLKFRFLDAGDNEIYTNKFQLANATNYEAAVYSFTAPSDAVKARVRFVVEDVPATLYIDDVCLKEWQSNKPRPTCEEDCKLKYTGENGTVSTWISNAGTWVSHDVDSDMQLCHNGDGTITIQGNVSNGVSEGGTPCGATDGWFLEVTLSNKKDWATWNGGYDTHNVDNGICADNHTTFDYWDVTGTLTGTGCNTGEIYPITGNKDGYQVQVGYGASRSSCDFGMAGWTVFDKNGIDEVFDIYFLLEEDCYNLSSCCSQINYANNSLEAGNFSSFTSSSNPNGTATLTTFGGSDAVDWDPSSGVGTNGSPITAFGANPGYWIDASTNGGLGALDGDRFYWLEPRSGAGGSDCIGAVSGADLLGSFCAGDVLEICGYVAAYDPDNINSNSVSTDFAFEIYTNNGNDPVDFITTPTGASINDDGGNSENFTLSLPASTSIQDLTGATFTGENGQVADWRTLNWQSICFQVVLKEDQSNYTAIVFSMSDGSDGMAIDNLSIRDITTPNAGKDTTLYTCETGLNLVAAKNSETWSKVAEPSGATSTIDASTGAITGLTENGTYKFLLSKTSDGTCHDTIKVQVNCATSTPTCCSQINYANNSLEDGNFSSFTSSSNPNGTATLTTFGGSDAVDWNPSGGLGTNGSPITAFGANPGAWVDASTNGGLGALDGDRFYWLEPRSGAGGSDCIGAVSGADLLGSFCTGDTLEICGYVAAYDPNNINSNSVNTDFVFEIYTNNGQDPADFITTPTGTTAVNDDGGNNESFKMPLPASANVLDITGNTFTGVNGQVADWRTLNWQSICFQVVLKEDQSNYTSIVFSMADGSDGMAVDNLSIRDITTPNAGRDTTIYTCSARLNLTNAQNGEEWSKVAEPSGASATIDASTGVITGLTENGLYKFLLSKTSDGTCHDTIKVQVNCTAEICDDGIDNDGDGLTDCEDPDCNSITISELSYSECVLTGAEYQATISIEVSWTNPPAGEGINVITPYNSQFIDIVGGATSPTTVQFVIAADNSTNPLSIAYTGGSSCGVDTYYDAPAPCPDPTERDMPCTNGSGFVGGIVFEDLNGDGLQDGGEPGLEGIMVTATDSIGVTVGQIATNNIGVFEFADLTDGGRFKLEFTAIPSGMYPTNGSTYKGTTVQYVDAPSCATTLGLLDPTENPCEAADNAILQNGYSVVACLPAGDDVTLAVKDITQLGTLWQTSANRNRNQFDNVPTIRMWETSDFENEEIFSMTIDPRDGTIYAVASPLYGDGSNVSSVLFEENTAPKVFKINPETGVVTRIAQLPGTLGLGAIDFDVINEQLLITNMDDGKIYRLNTDGVVLSSFDPLNVDDGISGQLPTLGDRTLGIAFNPIEKKVYYSVWSNHTTFITGYENTNNSYNTIRSVALDVNGAFLPATDQLEITVPYNNSSTTVDLTTPTADIAFNRAGDRLLLAEFAVTENNSNGQLSTSAHTSAVKEYQKNGGTWTLEPTYGSNIQGKYDIGSVTGYEGRNSRGGVDWAFERISGDTIFGNEDFILATGDALHVASYEGDFIYGYQFTPATGGNIANSILVDLDDDLVNADKYVYSDVDIYKDYCATLNLEIGNYVWLDSDEDGIQDLYEVGLSGVNVTLYSAAGDSLTSVITDGDGAYYFSENTSGFTGLTPNTTYYVVIGRGGQFNKETGALNFVFDMTVPNIGDGNYTDENDSDGVIGNPSYGHPIGIAGYPTIRVTTGEKGQNDYSFDFGFKEVCSPALAVNDSIPTCPGVEYEGSVSLNDSNYEDKIYRVHSNPSNGEVTMGVNGTFIYTGNTSTCESDEFVYQVCDPSNICCATALVYLDFADAIKPSLQNIPDNDTISCDEVVPLPPQIFAIDNCPRISLDVKEVDTQGEDGCSLYDYTITRTWTAIDQCGNSTSASQVIEVQDVVAPDIYRIYTMPNGKRMVAGVMELVGGNWKTVSLPIDFDTKPIILHQVTTNDGLTPVVAQIQNVSVSQFELRIAAEEANTNKRTRESVSWIAMEAGVQSTDYQFEMNSLLLSDAPKIVNFQNSFSSVPALFASAQTTNEEDPATVRHDVLTTGGMALIAQEEASNDVELVHANERVGYLALEKIGDLRDEKGTLLGEVGTTTMNGVWKTITLNNTYANPVVIANGLSSNDGESATVRIQNVELNSFEVKVEEWDYLDGNHQNETVSYMVVEGSIPLESPTYCDDGTDSLDIGVDFKAIDNCDVSVIINYTEVDTFIGATKLITRTWAAEDECGNSTSYSQQISCQGVSLQLKSILQGAMLNNTGNGLMRDDLRKKGILPLEEPYSKMPSFEHVNTGGGEIVDADLLTIDGANGIVDWVFVELRDANDRENVVATMSVLIQCDGDVVTVKGDSILHFTNTKIGDYFVAFRHRNHLGLITLNTESFTPSTIPFVDFTFAFTPVVGSNPSVEIDELESLWSGDLNGDGKVIYQGPNNDIFYMFLHVLQDQGNKDFLPNFISNSYTNDDFNLDGSVIYQGPNNDRAKLLFNTILRHPDNPQKFSNFIIYHGEGN